MIWRAIPQALHIALTAPRLPEADGPRQGNVGVGPPLRLLILGDSSAAGVGVAQQDQALAGQLVAALSPHVALEWTLAAKSGRTTRAALALLPVPRADVVVVALGVNDVITPTLLSRWRRNMARLCDGLDARFVYLTGVPPLGRFPLLPEPLRGFLGARAARFDAALAEIARARPHARHLPVDPALLRPETMASDGFHPGAPAYALWGHALAGAILRDLQAPD